jgi:pyrroloquinoline-quinone synthase
MAALSKEDRTTEAASVRQLSLEEAVSLPSVTAAVELIATRYDFRAHPYFRWMVDPATDVVDFRRSQVPFRFAVESFSQALAAVLARVPELELRLAVAENVAEEHGHGRVRASHKATFVQYLRALGATDADLHHGCPVTVWAFNQSLLDFCLVQPYESGAALLGIIEHLYVGISASIARTLRDRAWVVPGSQRHYDVHEKLDVSHARELLDLCEPAFSESRARSQIALGLLLGAHWFWRLYLDLMPPAR